MLDEWLLCYMRHDIQTQDYAPQGFDDVSYVTFAGYPVGCRNEITGGAGTPGIQAEIFATDDEGRQMVRFVYRIQ